MLENFESDIEKYKNRMQTNFVDCIKALLEIDNPEIDIAKKVKINISNNGQVIDTKYAIMTQRMIMYEKILEEYKRNVTKTNKEILEEEKNDVIIETNSGLDIDISVPQYDDIISSDDNNIENIEIDVNSYDGIIISDNNIENIEIHVETEKTYEYDTNVGDQDVKKINELQSRINEVKESNDSYLEKKIEKNGIELTIREATLLDKDFELEKHKTQDNLGKISFNAIKNAIDTKKHDNDISDN